MASGRNSKNPPLLNSNTSFENWEKLLKLWTLTTDVPKKNQGPAIVLSLEGKALECVLELDVNDINSENGVDRILEKLGTIYKKDSVDTAYEAFENFIYFKREASMTITKYITEFESRHHKAKSHGFTLDSSTLAFFLLNQAGLSDDHKRLVRATISKLDFDEVKTKLKKVFGSGETSERTKPESNEPNIKIEDINLLDDEEQDVLYGNYYQSGSYRGRGFSRGDGARGFYRNNRGNRGGRGQMNYSRGSYSNARAETDSHENRAASKKKSTINGFDRKGNRIKCNFCESIFHYTAGCPEKVYFSTEDDDDDKDIEIALYQSNLITEKDYHIFVAEASASAILDSGASATVAGKIWFDTYREGLPEKQQQEIQYMDSHSTFKFGSDQKFPSLFKAKIPARIGKKNITITTDIVDTPVPLLLSKDAMKSAETSINFKEDTVTMFGKKQEVQVTKSGHYAIPLNSSRDVLRRLDFKTDTSKITLMTDDEEDKHKIALKLHAQFGHPTKSKLVKLVERAGRSNDHKLIKEIGKVTEECQICKQFSKPSPKPIVGLPHASEFNEMVAMDLKFFDGHIILHLIDHLTRFSAATILKSKQPDEIISGLMRCWLSLFGPPRKFLCDNGGEFANKKFIELAESMNVRVLHTAAESPWSNGLVERHNATLAEILHKILAENNTDLQTALAWAVHAKNSLTNVHGFSPAQLAIGFTPVLPGVLHDKAPALEPRSESDVISDNLNCIKSARKAFIEAESSERIKRALVHNIRPGSDNKFFVGDIVFYKRNDSRRWKGPGKVIGHESSNILIKHGANYVRVHACRVLLEKRDEFYEEKNCKERTEKCESQTESEEDSTDNETPTNGNNQSLNDIEETRTQKTLKKGLKIIFKELDGDWDEGEVLRRTGKATGKYKHFWYIKRQSTGEVQEFDIENQFEHWEEKTTNENQNSRCNLSGDNANDVRDTEKDDENDVHDTDQRECESQDAMVNDAQEKFSEDVLAVSDGMKDQLYDNIMAAKVREIEKWKEEAVFEEVEHDGQECMTTTWVITPKMEGDKVVTKARLVARGYEEQVDVRADSPTCVKDNIRVLLSVAVAKGWKICSLDVKAAFLQGKEIDRLLFLKPPKEFRKENVIWKLKKVVYGLCDASRSWYLRMIEVLTNLGMKLTAYDQAVMTYKTNVLEGIVMIHVDDILYFGTQNFLSKVIQPFMRQFHISKNETETFKYVGIQMVQKNDSVELSQTKYVETMKLDLLPNEGMTDKLRYADENERKIFKQAVGQLGWVSGISRPDAAFAYCVLSTVQNQPQVTDFIKYKKAVRDLKSMSLIIKISKLDMDSWKIVVYSDASFANLKDGASQLGYIIFLQDKFGNSAAISWSSKKAKRVARSTLTAETLAAVEAVDTAYMVKKIIEDITTVELPPIELFVDNKSLFDTAKTTNVLADKRLLVDMAALRQMIEVKEVNINWVNSSLQLADAFTKAGANKQRLAEAISRGRL